MIGLFRRQFRGRPRQGNFRRQNFQYQDLDNPTNVVQGEAKGKAMVNFLDI